MLPTNRARRQGARRWYAYQVADLAEMAIAAGSPEPVPMEPLAVAVGNQDGLRAVIADLRRDRDGSATRASAWRDQAERLSLSGSASPRASRDALPKPEQPRTTEPSNRLVRVWRWDARDWVRPNLWLKWESVQGLTPSACHPGAAVGHELNESWRTRAVETHNRITGSFELDIS